MHTNTQCAYADSALWRSHIHFIGMYYTICLLLAVCSTLSPRGQAGWPRRRGKWGREWEIRADGPQIHFCLWCWRSSALIEHNVTRKEPGHTWLLNGLPWNTFVNTRTIQADTQRTCTDLAELLCHTKQKETKSTKLLLFDEDTLVFFNPA